MLFITTRLVSEQSRDARRRLNSRPLAPPSTRRWNCAARAAQLSSRLITELPVLRAHLTDPRLAADRPTIEAMADGYRIDLDALVRRGDRRRRHLARQSLAGPGLSGMAPVELDEAIASARQGRPATALVPTPSALVLLVSTPARLRRRGARHAVGRLRADRRRGPRPRPRAADRHRADLGQPGRGRPASSAPSAPTGRRSARQRGPPANGVAPTCCASAAALRGGDFRAGAHRGHRQRRTAGAARRLAAAAGLRRAPAVGVHRRRRHGAGHRAGPGADLQPEAEPAAARHRRRGVVSGGRRPAPCGCRCAAAPKRSPSPARSTR